MLLNPRAVERLKSVIEPTWRWSYRYWTHDQRDELTRMFIKEVVEQKVAELDSIAHTHEERLQHLAEQIRTEVDQAVLTRWQEETRRFMP